jgi:hypothetical protein
VTGDADVDRVLAERARLLARPLPEPDRPGDDEVVVIEAGGEHYALDAACVERVQPIGGVTPLPGLRPPWRGLVSVRGELLPALDLPAYLGRPPAPATAAAPVVSCAVVAVGGLRVALLSEAPPAMARRPADVLDVAGILADPALVVDDEARGRSG